MTNNVKTTKLYKGNGNNSKKYALNEIDYEISEWTSCPKQQRQQSNFYLKTPSHSRAVSA